MRCDDDAQPFQLDYKLVIKITILLIILKSNKFMITCIPVVECFKAKKEPNQNVLKGKMCYHPYIWLEYSEQTINQ